MLIDFKMILNVCPLHVHVLYKVVISNCLKPNEPELRSQTCTAFVFPSFLCDKFEQCDEQDYLNATFSFLQKFAY